MKDPEPFLKEMGFTAPCAVRSDAPAKIDPSTRIQINHDLVYVSRPDYLEKVRKKPLQYVARTTDPVTREVFRPTKKSKRRDYNGHVYLFSSDSTSTAFAANPSMYEFPPESMSRARPDSAAAGSPGVGSPAAGAEGPGAKEAGESTAAK